MIDNAKIYVKAGDGGSGCNSFIGKKFTRSRHPDGGNGGKGADVIIRLNKNIQTLESFRFKHNFKAEDGKDGRANKKQGANGRPCIIEVPPGTIVCDINNNLILRDLAESEEELVVAKGGCGGRGNTRAKSTTPGLLGEERHLLLELKLVAEIALIGYPNAGKSAFLSKISSARVKVASYPFTTVTPAVGVLEFSDFAEPAVLTVVEIPALVKDSHQGKGLGIQFLRHAERVKVLVHLIDMAASCDRDPFQDYQNLNQELKLYNRGLSDKPQVLVANKMDLPNAETNLKKFTSKLNKKIYPISASNGKGIEELLNHLRGYFLKE